ncbi:MAG TPA: peptidyl-tRNA hydrolase [Arthrobacter sp.]
MQDSNNFEHSDRGDASAHAPAAPAAEPVRRDAEVYVQPIMLLVDKTSPAAHIDAVHAAALASVLAFAGESLSCENPDPSWEAWLSGPFTKSVRRADAKTFEKLALKFAGEEHADIHIGKARAIAFRPTTYGSMSRHLSKLQVSGTDLPERATDHRVSAPEGSPVLVINESLKMSSGKAGAQAGHALFAWYLSLETPARRAWYNDGCQFRVIFAEQEAFESFAEAVPERLQIVDNGLTEIAPGTATAFVMA